MSKPRVAIFDFACCEGCQLQIVNLEEDILNLIDLVDVVEWREAMSEQSHEYDIAIIEGSITREEDAKRLEVIRSRAKILIALGACATMGGVNKMKNNFDLNEVRECVYGKDGKMPHLHTEMTKACRRSCRRWTLRFTAARSTERICPNHSLTAAGQNARLCRIIRSASNAKPRKTSAAMNTAKFAWVRSSGPVAALRARRRAGVASAAAAWLTIRMSKRHRRSWTSTT